MKISRISQGLLWIFMAGLLTLTACNKDEDESPMPENPIDTKTLIQTATDDDQFSILVDALVKADLVDALSGNGPFTVFAPTNDAFEQLFADLNISGLDDLTAETLKPILLFHVVGSKVMSNDLSSGYVSTLATATNDKNSVSLQVDLSKGVVLNNSSTVTTANISASNGVIHVIDKVMLPPSIVGLAMNNSLFSILVDAVVKANLVEALSSEGPFTVFAPTNDAFTALFSVLEVNGIADLTAEQLTPILLYHVVPDNVLSTELTSGMESTLNENSKINVDVMSNSVMLNETTKVIVANVQGTNGVVHAIDQVLLP